MDKVLIGNLSSKGESILNTYIEQCMPGAERVALQKQGIRGKIKTMGKRPETVLIIIDSVLYNECYDACQDVLSLPKVHKYEDDEGLHQFLIEKFGKIEIEANGGQGAEVGGFDDEFGMFDTSSVVEDTEDLNFGTAESLSVSAFDEGKPLIPPKNDELEALRKENEQQRELIDRLTSGESMEDTEMVKTLTDSIKRLKGELATKDEQISNLERDKYLALGKSTEAETILGELKAIKAERATLKESISQLTYEKTKLSKDNESLQTEIGVLQATEQEYEKLKKDFQKTKTLLDNVKIDLEAKKKDLESASLLKETLTNKYNQEKSKTIELDSKIASLTETNSALSDNVSSMQAEVDRLGKLLSTKETRLKELETELTTLKSSIKSKDDSIAELSQENNQYLKKYSAEKAELDATTEELTELRKRVSELEVETTELRTISDQYEKYKENMENTVGSYEQSIKDKDEELDELRTTIEDMKDSQNTSLQQAQDDYDSCQEEIMQLREINKELEAKVIDYDEVVEENSKLPELKREIKSLTSQVKTLQAKSTSLESESVSQNTQKDAGYRARIAELEEDKKDLMATIDELSEGVYASMQDSALPKVKLKTMIDMGTQQMQHFAVFGSASTHSNMVAYQEMRKSIQTAKTPTLVIDLSMDSYIDSEFKPKGVVSPIDWFTGDASIDEFIADTVFPNVKVVSIGLSFINTLYLLDVPWKQRLEGLTDKYSNVIIYVGCVTDVVARILYQSFVAVMQGFLMVNATPINLRTAILTLAGMYNMDKTKVCCVNLGAGSEVVFKKLSAKYDTAVWTDEKRVTL